MISVSALYLNIYCICIILEYSVSPCHGKTECAERWFIPVFPGIFKLWLAFASSFPPLLLFWCYFFFPLWQRGVYVFVVIWVYLFVAHGCKSLSQQNAADNGERIHFEPLQLLFLHIPVCFNLFLLSCVAFCSSAFGPATAALQLLACFQRREGGLTHYVKSFCPWGSQHRVMERWLSPISVPALTDGYLSALPLWRPKACVSWCWVKLTAAQTKSRPLDSSTPSHHVYMLQRCGQKSLCLGQYLTLYAQGLGNLCTLKTYLFYWNCMDCVICLNLYMKMK